MAVESFPTVSLLVFEPPFDQVGVEGNFVGDHLDHTSEQVDFRVRLGQLIL